SRREVHTLRPRHHGHGSRRRDSAGGRDPARPHLGRRDDVSVMLQGFGIWAQGLERGRRSPPFVLRVRSAYRFLPAFFFPPLAFFAIVCYPPLHSGVLRERSRSRVVAAAWHAHPMSAPVAF